MRRDSTNAWSDDLENSEKSGKTQKTGSLKFYEIISFLMFGSI